MTDEYIKRSNAIKAFDSNEHMFYPFEAQNRIKAIPAEDVRPVVLCRDCMYAPSGTDDGEDQGFALEWPEDDDNPCPCKCEDGWYSYKPKPDFFCANGKVKDPFHRQEAFDELNSIPPAAIAEVRHGEWVNGECSVCGSQNLFDFDGYNCESNFCPNCGADMREVNDEI